MTGPGFLETNTYRVSIPSISTGLGALEVWRIPTLVGGRVLVLCLGSFYCLLGDGEAVATSVKIRSSCSIFASVVCLAPVEGARSRVPDRSPGIRSIFVSIGVILDQFLTI
jgi:hypothetical protein